MAEVAAPAAPRLGTVLEEARAAEREGDLDRALRHYEEALREMVTSGGDAGVAADILRWIGTVRRMRDELELAAEAYEASLAVAEADGDASRRAAALNCLGILDQFAGALGSAEERYGEARALAASASDDYLIAMLDQNLATLANIRGDIQGAIESYESALSRLERLGRRESAASVLNNLGMAHVDLEDWSAGTRCFDRAYDLADGLRDSSLLAIIDLNRAELDLRQSKLGAARDSCDRAFETYSRIGSDAGRAEAFKLYGCIARLSGKPYLAANHLDAALDLARKCGDPLLEAETETERAVLFLEGEENAEALRSLNRAHALFGELEARRELFDLDRRLDRLEGTYLEVVERWGASIEAKDEYTAGHCERVADYASSLAADVGFTGRDLTWFRMGGFLHDVGKTAVPPQVLNKAGKLTDEEWAVMKSHTTVGDEIVRDLKFPWDVAPLVRSHHERWDGTGYPDGLAESEIPLSARILCLADVYDALTTARSYRGALSHAEAISIMERDSGAFDPELFPRFKRLMEARRAGERRARGRRARGRQEPPRRPVSATRQDPATNSAA